MAKAFSASGVRKKPPACWRPPRPTTSGIAGWPEPWRRSTLTLGRSLGTCWSGPWPETLRRIPMNQDDRDGGTPAGGQVLAILGYHKIGEPSPGAWETWYY